MRRPILYVSQILEWADAHFKWTGKWPTENSGRIVLTDESWGNIDGALRRGCRGLPGKWSLPRLLHEYRGKPLEYRENPPYPPSPLDIEQILAWADRHHSRTGKWPTKDSGLIEGTDEHWAKIDRALRSGYRGLPQGGSLAQLLFERRGKRNIGNLPQFSIEQILSWVDAHRERTGEWPKKGSGVIADTNEQWISVEVSLNRGTRGLPGGSSLAEFLREYRGVRNHLHLPRLSVRLILKWADAHFERTGNWPTEQSGPITDAPGETWNGVASSLRAKGRGLKARSSLAQILSKHRGKRNNQDLPPFKIEKILRWADAHFERTGEWPNQYSGPIAGTDETWTAVQIALRVGLRGLPGGSSVAELLREHRGVRNRANLPRLSVKKILAWADLHYKRTGNWPRNKTGAILDAPEETWSGVESALIQNSRGLKVKTTLAELLFRYRGVHQYERQPPLSLVDIRTWAEAYRERTGRWPTFISGPIPEAPGESWSRIARAFAEGRRGLTMGGTLSEFLTGKSRRGWILRPLLTEEQILGWADAYFKKHGEWPTQRSGCITGTAGERWETINNALRQGNRGLKPGSSLSRLLREHGRGKTSVDAISDHGARRSKN